MSLKLDILKGDYITASDGYIVVSSVIPLGLKEPFNMVWAPQIGIWKCDEKNQFRIGKEVEKVGKEHLMPMQQWEDPELKYFSMLFVPSTGLRDGKVVYTFKNAFVPESGHKNIKPRDIEAMIPEKSVPAYTGGMERRDISHVRMEDVLKHMWLYIDSMDRIGYDAKHSKETSIAIGSNAHARFRKSARDIRECLSFAKSVIDERLETRLVSY